MAAPRGAWRRFHKGNGSDIGKLAIIVYVCRGCGLWHERGALDRTPPAACTSCGRLDFDRFDSKTEAKRWAALLMLQRAGLIAELERQVRFPLLTVHSVTGKPVRFGDYVADFRYRRADTGEQIIEDSKGGSISEIAEMKLRIMQASGRTVTLTST